MILNTMKILFYHLKKKINKKGEAPIYVRVTITGDRKEYSTGVFVKPEQWDSTQAQVINSPNAVLHNCELSRIRSKILTTAIDVNKKNELSVYTLQNAMNEGQKKHFLVEVLKDFVKKKITEEPLSKKTVEKIEISEKHILNFLLISRVTKIEMHEVDCDLANKLITWCETKKSFGKQHTSKIFGVLRQAVSYAVIKGIIKHNPLKEIIYKREKPKPIISLTGDELIKLQSHIFTNDTLNKVRDLYILQCLTGLCYIDLMNFNKEKIINKVIKNKTHLVYKMNRQKTKTEALIPLNTNAIQLLSKYNYELPQLCNQTYNRYIKEIANIVGINKYLTTHTGRKTFGMICISKGYSMESTSKMMGHSSVKITQSVYAQVQIDRVLNEFIKYR